MLGPIMQSLVMPGEPTVECPPFGSEHSEHFFE